MLVLDIQRMSTEDGPGLRTTVFLKGCPLHCAWCHNPESISKKPQIIWLETRCIGCGTCIHTCPNNALTAGIEGIEINREKCLACGTCVDACPALALEMKGKEMTPIDLVNEVLKDKAYFGDLGGVTLSGGEALAQVSAVKEVLRLLKENNVNTAIDTCGYVSWNAFEEVIPYTDLFLYDFKVFDTEGHKTWTGAPNEQIKSNFERLYERVGKEKIWIRTPIIPGATDTKENIEKIASFVNGRTVRYELCAFNNLCRDEYRRLGHTWKFSNAALKTKEEMEELHSVAYNLCKEAIWTGAVAVEKGE